MLGGQDPFVLVQSSVTLMFTGREVELAEGYFEEAIRLDPNLAGAWMWGGWAKMILGDHQTAIEYLRRALRLDPLDFRIFFSQTGLALAYFFLGNYEEGLKQAAAASRHQPDHLPPLRVAMACNALCGNIGAAQDLWRQVAQLSPLDRVSVTARRLAFRREQDLAKLQEAYRLAGMPE
jgi:tetratricopeptide (TPR) repeat protein